MTDSTWTKGSTHTFRLDSPVDQDDVAINLTTVSIRCFILKPDGTTQVTGSPFTVTATSATIADQVLDNSLATEAGMWKVVWVLFFSGEPVAAIPQEVECIDTGLPIPFTL